jgi:hypothetical protein
VWRRSRLAAVCRADAAEKVELMPSAVIVVSVAATRTYRAQLLRPGL